MNMPSLAIGFSHTCLTLKTGNIGRQLIWSDILSSPETQAFITWVTLLWLNPSVRKYVTTSGREPVIKREDSCLFSSRGSRVLEDLIMILFKRRLWGHDQQETSQWWSQLQRTDWKQSQIPLCRNIKWHYEGTITDQRGGGKWHYDGHNHRPEGGGGHDSVSCWFFYFEAVWAYSQTNFPFIKTKPFKVVIYKKGWQIFRPKSVKIKIIVIILSLLLKIRQRHSLQLHIIYK